MASRYWIKLYIEILHDRKMAKMSDRLFKQTILLFLLAGETDKNGLLPPLEDIAWALRIDEKECNDSLQELQRLGVAHCNDEKTWFITHFEKRQMASTSTERSKAFRQRNSRESLNKPSKNNATNTQRNVAPELELESDINSTLRRGPLTNSVLKICIQDYDFVACNEPLKNSLIATLRYLVSKGVSAGQVVEFEEWRKGFHWSRGSPPTFKQVGEFWPQYEEWIRLGKPEVETKKGDRNGHRTSERTTDEITGTQQPGTGGAITEAGKAKLASLSR